jgi:hypothetical protein
MKLFKRYAECGAGGPESRVPAARGLLSILAMIAAALASAVLLVLGGCVSSAGIASTAQTLAPASVGLDSGVATPELPADWWRVFEEPALNDLI